MDSTEFAQEVLRLTNEFRAQNGLPALTMNQELATTAQKYSQTMATGDFFSHTGEDGSVPRDRAEAEGYTTNAIGENLAAGQRTPEQVVQGWINSPGHRRNLLTPAFTEMGLGYYELANDTGLVNYNRYWTQLFGSGDLTPNNPTPVTAAAPAPLAPVSRINFVGNANQNFLTGNALDNVMVGLAGNDQIRALNGNDFLKGGLGNDRLWGDLGNDILVGDEGIDILLGGHGSDRLVGGLDNDALIGGGLTFGMPEVDLLNGGGGADRFILGNQIRAFYNNSGVNDYAIILDLITAAGDTIELNGQHSYSLGAAPGGTANGQGLFVDKNGVSELVAVIQADRNLAITDSTFVYV